MAASMRYHYQARSCARAIFLRKRTHFCQQMLTMQQSSDSMSSLSNNSQYCINLVRFRNLNWYSTTCKEFDSRLAVSHGGFAVLVLKKCFQSQEFVKENRKSDFDSYLCTLLLPQSVRTSVFALRAFNVETATVSDAITEKHIGLMRLQFWKDVISRIYEGVPPQQPVAIELHKAVHKHKLSKRLLTRIVEARVQTLDANPFQSVEDLETYAENTSSSLLYLTLEALGIKNMNADHAASHIGKAQGIVTLLRAMPYHASKRQVLLPLDITIRHNLSHEAILRRNAEQAMKDVIYDVASAAHIHLETARSFKASVPRESIPAFLISGAIEAYLRRLQKVNFDIYHKNCLKKESLLPLLLWLQNKRKKY